MDPIREFFLEAHPNPERIGCPDEDTLKALAEDRLPPEYPARLHLSACSECVAEYLGYRGEWKETQQSRLVALDEDTPPSPTLANPTSATRSERKNRTRIVPLALAAAVLILIGGTVAYRTQHTDVHEPFQTASSVPQHAKVDLFEATTSRGAGSDEDAAPLQRVVLPAAVVNLSVILPRFSQSGQYKILVSGDRAGAQVVAMGHGVAEESAGKVTVDVTLDLRAAKPGTYFLATVRGSDNGTYYYPLQVQ